MSLVTSDLVLPLDGVWTHVYDLGALSCYLEPAISSVSLVLASPVEPLLIAAWCDVGQLVHGHLLLSLAHSLVSAMCCSCALLYLLDLMPVWTCSCLLVRVWMNAT